MRKLKLDPDEVEKESDLEDEAAADSNDEDNDDLDVDDNDEDNDENNDETDNNPPESKPLEDMTKAELQAYANDRGITVSGNKNEIIAAIRDAEGGE
jgi:hypothetical protein